MTANTADQSPENHSPQTPCVDLTVEPVHEDGRDLFRITARIGDEPFSSDLMDPADDDGRRRFLAEVRQRAEDAQIAFDYAAADGQLQRTLQEGGDSHDSDDDPSQRLSSEDILGPFGIRVLGMLEDQSILCWMEHTRKTWIVRTPARWPVNEMLLAIGPTAETWLGCEDDSEDDDRANMISPAEVRRALALVASEASRITAMNQVGQGIWLMDDRRFLIVNGAQAYLYDGQEFEPVDHPRVGRWIIDFNADARWNDQLSDLTPQMTPLVTTTAFAELVEIIDQWNWSHPWDSKVAASLILATFIQATWTWRPRVAVTGASNSGKTTFCQRVLVPVLGGATGTFVTAYDNVTEAGLRQRMAHHSKPVVLDEFENNVSRDKILELFRTASRGGTVGRGTQDQRGREFRINHIGWFMSIESGGRWQQDSNRILRLEMNPPESRCEPYSPTDDQLVALCERLMAVALNSAPAAIPLADRIKSTRVDGIDPRVVESFSVPAAMYAVVRHGRDVTDEEAHGVLTQMLRGRESLLDRTAANESQLLQDILTSTIRVDLRDQESSLRGEQTVAQLLQIGQLQPRDGTSTDQDDSPRFESQRFDVVRTLDAYGIRLIRSCNLRSVRDDHDRLFIAHDLVLDSLLRNTRWRDSRIDQLLRRIPGAEAKRQRCAGTRLPGVLLPWGRGGLLDLADVDQGAPEGQSS